MSWEMREQWEIADNSLDDGTMEDTGNVTFVICYVEVEHV